MAKSVGAKACFLVAPHIDDVLNAVQSLYKDELRPVGRILRKRAAEYAAARLGLCHDGEDVGQRLEVDGDELRAVCKACEVLRVSPEKGGDWSVSRVGWAPRFVDIYSRYDSYPPELWAAFDDYCKSPAAEDLTLPGGRYVCAKALMARGLLFLAGLSLGRICHIVQLALTEKRILGYFSQSVVPYGRSQSMRKEAAAKTQQPCSGATPMTLATMDAARAVLREILDAAPNGEVPLSNIKRLFRSKFHLELSETSFGYSKVSDFLQDVRFRDLLTVHLRGRGYVVTKPAGISASSGVGKAPVAPPKAKNQVSENSGKVICLADQLHFCASPSPVSAAATTTSMTISTVVQGHGQACVWWPPVSTPGDFQDHARSVTISSQPEIVAAPVDSELRKRRPLFKLTCDLTIGDQSQPDTPTTGSTQRLQLASPVAPPMSSWRLRASRCVVQKTFLEVPETPAVHPSPACRRSHSAPPGCGDTAAADFASMSNAVSRSPKRIDSRRSSIQSTTDDSSSTFGEEIMSTTSSASWKVHSPDNGMAELFASLHPRILGSDASSMTEEASPETGANILLTPSRLTPGRLRTKGVLVQNTFLHIAAPLPSPVRSGRRSSSLPPSGTEIGA
jgi:hypothetical protein